MAGAYQKEEHTTESEPAPSGEMESLPGNLQYLALGQLVRVTTDSGAPEMEAACASPVWVKCAVSLLTP